LDKTPKTPWQPPILPNGPTENRGGDMHLDRDGQVHEGVEGDGPSLAPAPGGESSRAEVSLRKPPPPRGTWGSRWPGSHWLGPLAEAQPDRPPLLEPSLLPRPWGKEGPEIETKTWRLQRLIQIRYKPKKSQHFPHHYGNCFQVVLSERH